MQDVRNCLGMKSVAWKIEKRVLERIGHVVRMGNERMVKAFVFGWYEGLEGTDKRAGRKRKTTLYWKKLLKEGGCDWTNVERLANDRQGWKRMVNERMKHLDMWERQRGHGYEWAVNEVPVERNQYVRVNEFVCMYDGCGKVCRSRAGLTMHQKRMHRAALDRVRFVCEKCGVVCETEGAKVNHERSCGGGRVDGNVRECEKCGRNVSRANYARHRRACRGGAVGGGTGGGGGRWRGAGGRTAECSICHRVLSAANMARHERTHRVWDPGSGPNP